MDANEIAAEWRIPLYKIKQMQARGILKVGPTNEATGKIRALLASGKRLPVLDLLKLLREPTLLHELPPKYRDKAAQQVAALGDVPGEAMGDNAPGLVMASAVLDPLALNAFAADLLERIPPGGCFYAALACRVLWNVPAPRLAETFRYLRPAFMNVKAHPALAGFVSIKDNQSFFKKPEMLDL